MNTCPKCGSPETSKESDGKIVFSCGSYTYSTDGRATCSRLCFERQEKNEAQRKLHELEKFTGEILEHINQAVGYLQQGSGWDRYQKELSKVNDMFAKFRTIKN